MDLLILAVVAGVLMYRLNAVLGQRDKDDPAEKNSFPVPGTAQDDAKPAHVVALPPRTSPQPGTVFRDDGPMSQERQVQMLVQADGSFDEARFLAGARAAFSMILTAFAEGDKNRLLPLLSDELYRDFSEAIDDRISQQHKLETTIQSIDDVAITHARIQGNVMSVTVRIVSTQNNLTRDAGGAIVSGDDKPDEVTDFWVFRRLIGNVDPNWILIATESQA